MTIFIRIWLAFVVVLCIGGYLFFTNLEKHVTPTAQQVVEDTLIDTSQILASMVSPTMSQYANQVNINKANINKPNTNEPNTNQANAKLTSVTQQIDKAFQQTINAKVWNNHKQALDFHIYITDKRGIVIYDSHHKAVGTDYSRWNDVYHTLNGNYGARATRTKPNDAQSSVMYVAAPIYQSAIHQSADNFEPTPPSSTSHLQNDIIGVLTVGKPNLSLIPYLNVTYDKMVNTALWVGISSMILAALVAMWIRRSIYLVNRYTQSLAQDTIKPRFHLASELNQLSDSIGKMRDELENKAYVTQYVHTLTHELKSPITAIQASSELLMEDLPSQDREKFSQNIHHQCQKLQTLVDQLLLLAKLEQPNFKLNRTTLNLANFVNSIVTLNLSKFETNNIDLQVNIDASLHISADKFWLEQALQNILENAIHFCDQHIIINARLDNSMSKKPNQKTKVTNTSLISFNVINTGEHIAEYALPKLFDRYFSVPKSSQARKGTGIGLTLVKEVVEKHGWQVGINNTELNNKKAVIVSIHHLPLVKQ